MFMLGEFCICNVLISLFFPLLFSVSCSSHFVLCFRGSDTLIFMEVVHEVSLMLLTNSFKMFEDVVSLDCVENHR